MADELEQVPIETPPLTKADTADGGDFRFFIPITKVDEATRQVWGWASVEEPDRADEMMDYASSKPYFKEWSEETLKRSNGLSRGNVREMHTNIAAGKVIDLQCDDSAKSFPIGTEVVDDNSWKKVQKGVLTGFSVGGKYVKRWMDNVNGKTIMRYTAKPNEVSLVDVPAVPHATFQFFKSDGTVEPREFVSAPQYEYASNGDGGDIRVTRVTLAQNGQLFDLDVPQLRKQQSAPAPISNQNLYGDALQSYQAAQAHTPLPISTEAMPPSGKVLGEAANNGAHEMTEHPNFSKASLACPHCGESMTVEKAGACKCTKCGKMSKAIVEGETFAMMKDDNADDMAMLAKTIGIAYKGDEAFYGHRMSVHSFSGGECADPINETFHVGTPGNAKDSVAQLNKGIGKDVYEPREWAILGRRVARFATQQTGTLYKFNPREKNIERVKPPQEETMKKSTQDMVAQMRTLTADIRSQAGDSPSLDQLDAALDVMNDSASAPEIAAGDVATELKPLAAAAPADGETPTAPKTTETPTVGKTDAPQEMQKMEQAPDLFGINPAPQTALAKQAPAVMSELPPPPPSQPFTMFAPMGDDFYIKEKMPQVAKALLAGGKYARDNAMEAVRTGDRYDTQLFDMVWHALLRKTLEAGGFNELNKSTLFSNGRQIHAMDWNEIQARGLGNDFAKGISSTTAPGYYLQQLVKLMLPVVTPLANRISQQRPRTGGKQAEWRVQLGFTSLNEAAIMLTPEASTTLGSTTGSGQAISESPLLFQTPYSRIAVNDGVTVEAQYAMLGYQDALQYSIITALISINRTREMSLLWNNKQAIGAAVSVSTATTGSGGGLGGNSNDKFAVTALTGIGWRYEQLGAGGKGGASQVQGESAATLSGSVSLATADAVTISFAAVKGAVAYNLYYVPAGVAGNARYVGTYTVNSIRLTALPTSAFANTYPTTDGTANSVGYEGMVPWCELATIYGNAIPSKSFIDQAGAALTALAPNRISEWDTILAQYMSNWQAAPSLIIGSPASISSAMSKIGSSASGPYRIETRGNQGSVVGGMWMNGYVNNFALGLNNVPQVIDVMSHPYLADGTFLFASETIPYPMAQESRGWLIEQQIPLTYWPLATFNPSWQYELFMDEVLESQHPGIQGAIVGVNVS